MCAPTARQLTLTRHCGRMAHVKEKPGEEPLNTPPPGQPLHLFSLPAELIDGILLYMSYDEIARLRLVSGIRIRDVC